MASELSYEASDEASENELLERSLSVWKGWSALEWEDFTPIALDIHTACSIGHYEWVRSIIVKNEGIALDRKNHGGWTPLMYACYIGHDNIVNLLINAGCNTNMKNPRGHTPLMLAASCGNESVARTLVRRGAQLELSDKNGWTALFHATYAGHQNFVAFLLEAGANVDAIEPSTGITPFMVAASEGHEIIVQQFLQHGVNVQTKAYNGDMARSLALLNGYMKIVSLIDNHVLPVSCLRSEPDLDSYHSSSDDAKPRKHPSSRNIRLKSQGPSIRDGPEAIARMIDRTRHTDAVAYPSSVVLKGYVSFPAYSADNEETKLSYRDVTSPINPEDYKDSSGSREFDDFNDDSNAFTKTGAITIKSSSSSSGGLIAALGLSREGSIDSDDSHSYEQTTSSSDGVLDNAKNKSETEKSRGVDVSENIVPSISTPDTDIQGSRKIAEETSNVSPRTNKTSLSHLKIPDKESVSSQLAVEQQENGAVSPLRDYFPLDSSFPVGMAAPPKSDSKANDKVPAQHSCEPSQPDAHHSLPKDNMTQAEIVNRFLKNLTLDHPEKTETQFSGYENRWASETRDDQTGNACSCGVLYSNITEDQGLALSLQDGLVSNSVMSSSNLVNHNINNEIADIQAEKASQNWVGVNDENSGESEGYPNMDPKAADVYGHLPLGSNPSHHHKEPVVLLQNQQRPHHPQLNHHHPLHNRHRHNSVPSLHDGPSNNNMRNTPPCLNNIHIPSSHQAVPSQVGTGLAPAFVHDLPQEYFYSDIETAGQFRQPSFGPITSVAAVQTAGSAVGTSHAPIDYGTQLATASNPLSHLISPTVDNKITDLQYKTDSSLPSTVSHNSQAQLGQPSNQSVTPSCNGDGQITSKSNNEVLVGINSHLQNPQQPPASTSSSSQQQVSQPELPTVSSIKCSSPATIIIPGHVTSQPVLNSIAWLEQGAKRHEGPRDLAEMLTQLGLMKYLEKFEEQDVDLQVFLSLTDNDLKELGIKLFGPRKKMTNAIARWHSNAPIASNSLEQAYADKLEGEMQEMAIQLNQAYENKEHLKAQVLQEQQLRSVTEGCLMEERGNWEQARQLLHEARGKMRTMGDLMSRLRLHQKELRKQMEKISKQKVGGNAKEPAKTNPAVQHIKKDTSHLGSQPVTAKEKVGGTSDQVANESGPESGEGSKDTGMRMGNLDSNFSPVSIELLKKSEKCLKEMQQTLTSLVLNAEHILKSTHISNVEKDLS